MIQRIQTVFLFFAAVFAGVLFFTPIASFTVGDEMVKLSVFGVENHTNALFLLVLAILMVIVPFVTIFMYKKREFQLKLSSLNVLLNAMLCGLVFLFYVNKVQADLSAETVTYLFGTYIPLINMVLSILAMRWIKKDIELIKSVDRLR
ncbi:MAG: DUF4293 domain-containing protein [Bacteroidales bacterium]|nr:DUF4293 domain-containing protein [Bacteroidales bacterium]